MLRTRRMELRGMLFTLRTWASRCSAGGGVRLAEGVRRVGVERELVLHHGQEERRLPRHDVREADALQVPRGADGGAQITATG